MRTTESDFTLSQGLCYRVMQRAIALRSLSTQDPIGPHSSEGLGSGVLTQVITAVRHCRKFLKIHMRATEYSPGPW